MVRFVHIATLITYSVVVSQPLAYLFFMASAQRALSAPAYIELRHGINRVMTRRVPVVYGSALVTLLMLLASTFRIRNDGVGVTTAIALLCLVVDAFFMIRENGPLNGVVDRWSTTDYPDDWQDYRNRWFAIFGYRQVVLLIGLVSLVAGAVLAS